MILPRMRIGVSNPIRMRTTHPWSNLAHALDLRGKPGQAIKLSAKGSVDPDGDALIYRWWQYQEADSYPGEVEIH